VTAATAEDRQGRRVPQGRTFVLSPIHTRAGAKRNENMGHCGTLGPSALIDVLASQVARLIPSHRDPHRFHEEKSEIVAALRQIARELANPTDPRGGQ
jgi:hypothetical protein